MSASGTTLNLDEVEVGCAFIDPRAGSRPHLLVELSLRDRSPNRQREIYLPIQSSFHFIGEDGSPKVIGPGMDVTPRPTGLTDVTIPRLDTMKILIGLGLDLVS